MNEVVGAIIRTIDECSKPGWGNLEECLGTDFLCAIAYENEWAFVEPQFDDDDDEEFEGFDEYIGITYAFSSLKRLLWKDTRTAIKHSKGFFDRLSKVNKIYSYGFSFSEVDMPYIEEIAKIVVPRQTRWYFNQYDMENNKEYIEMVKKLGFKVRKCKRW